MKKRILILDHDRGGGANEYVKSMISIDSLCLILKYDLKSKIFFVTNILNKEKSFKIKTIKDIVKIIKLFNIREIFLNELVDYPNILDLIDVLVDLKKDLGVDLIFPIHDYFCICPVFYLLNYKQEYCKVPNNLSFCNKCLKLNPFIKIDLPYFQEEYLNLEIQLWREKFYKLLQNSSKILFFSKSSVDILKLAYPDIDNSKIEIKPHKVDYIRTAVIKKNTKTVNISVIGHISTHKGLNIICSIADYIYHTGYDIKIHHFGTEYIYDNDFSKSFNLNPIIIKHGKYNKGDLPELMEKNEIDCVLIPSIWPETFSYTTEEAIKMGMPVAVFDLGAPAERVKNYSKGIILENKNPEYIINKLLSCLEHNDLTALRKSEFEPQIDYSDMIIHKKIKILSYYLPQFYPIPENDLWHGKGFTEWTKVKSAESLFKYHYQPHIPNEDLGYYILNSPEILKKQADMMKKAGVFGQIFYHYWFLGKQLLEKPAQILLKNKDIDMNFCFCWANESWTKKWDSNEKETLVEQLYSKDDAYSFINYLIPFFKDSRYIKIDDRPLLFIYRVASIPNDILKHYLNVWEIECNKNNINKPFIVPTLIRGCDNPREFDMDAAVDRVPYDWREIMDCLIKIRPSDEFGGMIFDYNKVADFYLKQNRSKSFLQFSSLSTNWDNTPRYDKNAIMLHGSSPAKFQKWLEELILYSESKLPEDKQIIVVNAWNEWAEGAHLEPDKKFGYAYLNSIGRALSNCE